MSGQLVGEVTPDPSKSRVFNESHNYSYLWGILTLCVGWVKAKHSNNQVWLFDPEFATVLFAMFSSVVFHSLYFLASVIQVQLCLRSCFLSSFFSSGLANSLISSSHLLFGLPTDLLVLYLLS